MKRCSFDFDETLDRPAIQAFAKELIEKGFDVWICTARVSDGNAPNPNWNKDLYKVAENLKIPITNIIFCEFEDKWKKLKDIEGMILHLDDDWTELDMLNKYTKIKGISSWGNPNWESKCRKILNI